MRKTNDSGTNMNSMPSINLPEKGYAFIVSGSLIGLGAGIFTAYKRNSGLLGYVGWILLFNTVGWYAGTVIQGLYDSKK